MCRVSVFGHRVVVRAERLDELLANASLQSEYSWCQNVEFIYERLISLGVCFGPEGKHVARNDNVNCST